MDKITYNEDYKNPKILVGMYWKAGMSQEEMANELNCSSSTISKYMRRNNISTRRDLEYKLINYIESNQELVDLLETITPKRNSLNQLYEVIRMILETQNE